MIFVCRIDGTEVGEFPNEEFHAKVMAGEFAPDDHYWTEGMSDWRPISEYRPLAKTQRISFAPPSRATIKIDTAAVSSEAKPASGFSKFLARLRNRKQ